MGCWALTASFPLFFSFSSICERVTPRLSHANSAVVLSAVKVLMKFMEMLSKDLDYYGTLLKKLAPPLVTLLSAEPELQYVALRNINLIVQKRCVPSFPVLQPPRGAGSVVSVCRGVFVTPSDLEGVPSPPSPRVPWPADVAGGQEVAEAP